MAVKASAKSAGKAPRKPAPKSAAKSTATSKTSKPRSDAKTTSAKPASKPRVTSPARTLPKTAAAKPSLSVVKDGQTVNPGLELKKKELLDEVVKRTDVKKKFAKPVLEAMIEVLGEALAQERSLNLQPMGKVMPKRTKQAGSNRVITARIRQSMTAKVDKSDTPIASKNPPVAKPAE